MIVYNALLLITCLGALIIQDKRIVHLKKNDFFTNLLIVVTSLPLILIAGLRDHVGTDTVSYIYRFSLISNFEFIDMLMNDSPVEKAFEVLLWLISRLTTNTNGMLVILATFSVIPVLKAFYLKSNNYVLSVFIFVTSMLYFNIYNGMRQMLAAVVIFYAFTILYEKNRVKFTLFLLLGMAMHSTSVLVIPILFLLKRIKYNKQIVFFTVVLTMLVFLFKSPIVQLLSTSTIPILGDLASEYSDILILSNRGASYLRYLVILLPVAFLIYLRKKITDKDLDFYIHMGLFANVFLFLSMSDWLFARFSLYFELYLPLYIPLLIKSFKSAQSRQVLILSVVILYYLYMLFLLPRESNLLPYNWVL